MIIGAGLDQNWRDVSATWITRGWLNRKPDHHLISSTVGVISSFMKTLGQRHFSCLLSVAYLHRLNNACHGF
jgi:hypothetical protein